MVSNFINGTLLIKFVFTDPLGNGAGRMAAPFLQSPTFQRPSI